jgi:LPS export ABC transporter protein LptC
VNWRLVIAACLVLVLAFAIRWWLPSERVSTTAPTLPDTRFDYTLTEFSARFTNAEGQVELLIEGPRLEHDSATRIATVTEPRFHLAPDSQDWTGRSRTGRFERDEELLVLEGEVVLSQPLEEGMLTINAEILHHHRPARTISADTPVEMHRPGTWLRAGGLMIRLDQDTIELSNHVQAQMQVVSPTSNRQPNSADDGSGTPGG